MELGLGPGKSWKINQKVAAFLIRVRFRFLHSLSSSTVRLGSIYSLVDLVHVYENLTCLISTRLNSPGNIWKIDISGPQKSRKMHIKSSWKVVENRFQCSVCTLVVGHFNKVALR